MQSEFDVNRGFAGCSLWVPGIYCYIQAGKDIENLVSGIYFVKIFSDDGNQTWYKKFIKN